MGAPRQMFFHFLKFYFTIPLFFCSLDYPSSFLNMIPSESEPKAHWWLAHPRVYVAQNRFWHLLTISDPRRLYIYIGLISSHFCEEMLSALPMLLLLRVLPRWMENSGESSLFARPMGQVATRILCLVSCVLWHLVTFGKVANDSDIFCSTSWLAHRSCSSWTCP